MDKIRATEEIIEELENCFLGHDEYILNLLAELKKSRDKEVQRLETENKELIKLLKNCLPLAEKDVKAAVHENFGNVGNDPWANIAVARVEKIKQVLKGYVPKDGE